MLSYSYIGELQKAVSGYRETIAAPEDIKRNVRRCEKSELWWEEADTRIHHLKQSITSLEHFLGTHV